jgi:ferric-dicitrate binding protein FerR (iron transport regulator)
LSTPEGAIVKEAARWFVELNSGIEVIAERLAAFEAWLVADPRHMRAYDRIAEIASWGLG